MHGWFEAPWGVLHKLIHPLGQGSRVSALLQGSEHKTSVADSAYVWLDPSSSQAWSSEQQLEAICEKGEDLRGPGGWEGHDRQREKQ